MSSKGKRVARIFTDSAVGLLIEPPKQRTVFAQNSPIATVSQTVTPHSSLPVHIAVIIVGSATVFVNNRPVARKGDLASCGHKITNGCSTVFAD